MPVITPSVVARRPWSNKPFFYWFFPLAVADGCIDLAPPNDGACSPDTCDSAQVIAGPFCLKTCGRCSVQA
jgi:hypothetical protein